MQPDLPPGPRGQPIVGDAWRLRRDPLGFVRELYQTYGDVVTIHAGRTPNILFFRPEHVHTILVEQARNFHARAANRNMRQVLGDGLITANGDAHRRQRRLVQPAFHKRRVEAFAGLMVEHTEQLLETWQPGLELDIFATLLQLTIRIAARTLFNVDAREQSAELSRHFNAVINHPLGRFNVDLPFTRYGKRMDGLRRLDAYIYALIAQRRAEGSDAGDMLSMLLRAQDDQGAMTDQQIRDQVVTFFAAGHETTATNLTWTFYLLSEYPGVRAKLQSELHTVLAGRAPTLDDLPNLPYLDWVINESLRLYPPIWSLGRHAMAAFDLAGYHFPAGTKIMLTQWVTHYLPEVWGDPDVFRPERWDPANGPKLPPGAYFPFSLGPRMCIGMSFALLEAKLVLATILQRYAPQLVPGHPVVPIPRITLRPKYGMRMTLLPTPAHVTTHAASASPAPQPAPAALPRWSLAG